MNVEFEHDYQQKIMRQWFAAPTTIASPQDVMAWRQAWMTALKSWHSPYKALIDCTHLHIAATSEVKEALARMQKFFEGFFLKKAVGYAFSEAQGHANLPFSVAATLEDAEAEIGIRTRGPSGEAADLRAAIHIENHFRQHVVEVSFSQAVKIESKEHLATLRSKLTNNLMQWHSKWSLMIDCTNLEFSPTLHADFKAMERFFRGVFMKHVVGYSPKGPKDSYPFTVYRARHKAAAELEGEGAFSGDEADCKSKKVKA